MARGCGRLFKEAVAKWGTVDVLVNNAGITRDGLIMRMKLDQWQSVIDTNLTGVFLAIQVSAKMVTVISAMLCRYLFAACHLRRNSLRDLNKIAWAHGSSAEQQR